MAYRNGASLGIMVQRILCGTEGAGPLSNKSRLLLLVRMHPDIRHGLPFLRQPYYVHRR
jgi:hypothetical protein